MPISDTQRQILVAAAQQEARLAVPPASLPAGARNAVIRSMLKNSLIAEGAAPDEPADFTWRHDDAGAAIVLQITDVGLAAIAGGAEDEVAPPTTEQDAAGAAVASALNAHSAPEEAADASGATSPLLRGRRRRPRSPHGPAWACWPPEPPRRRRGRPGGLGRRGRGAARIAGGHRVPARASAALAPSS